MKTTAKLTASVAMLCGAMSASAASFDGSKPLLCALQHVTECETGTECVRVWTHDINTPDFLQVDATNKVISATPEAGTWSWQAGTGSQAQAAPQNGRRGSPARASLPWLWPLA